MPAEVKILERAEMYLRKLSCGVNPLTEESLPETDACRQERIGKCLLYVADYLQKHIAPKQPQKQAKPAKQLQIRKTVEQPMKELALAPEIVSRIEVTEEPVSVSGMLRRINALIPADSGMIPLAYADIAEVLSQEGVFQKQNVEGVRGLKEANLPTSHGEELGFTRVEADIRGHHTVYTKCNAAAQRFIVENIQKYVEQANVRLARRNAEKAARGVSGSADAMDGSLGTGMRPGKEKFHLTEEQIAGFVLDDSPLPVSEIARRLNALIPAQANIEQLYFKKIRDWFVAQGMLEERKNVVGKVSFSPTEQGLAAGILVDKRIGKNGEEYEAVLYNAAAQKLVLDHVNELA